MLKQVFGREEHRTLILMVTLFALGIATGCFFSVQFPDTTNGFIKEIFRKMQHILQLSGWRLAIGIFLNNLRVSLILLVIGALLPFVPGLIIFFNGLMIGIISQNFLSTQTIGLYSLLMSLLPHGVLEIPAVVLAAMAGTLLGKRNWHCWLKGTQSMGCKAMLHYAGMWLLIITVLLAPAAIIEVFITPELI